MLDLAEIKHFLFGFEEKLTSRRRERGETPVVVVVAAAIERSEE